MRPLPVLRCALRIPNEGRRKAAQRHFHYSLSRKQFCTRACKHSGMHGVTGRLPGLWLWFLFAPLIRGGMLLHRDTSATGWSHRTLLQEDPCSASSLPVAEDRGGDDRLPGVQQLSDTQAPLDSGVRRNDGTMPRSRRWRGKDAPPTLSEQGSQPARGVCACATPQ